MPTAVVNITSLRVRANWGMASNPASLPVQPLAAASRENVSLRCNVGIDMFGAPNPGDAQVNTQATAEIMIWLGSFGGPWPLGFSRDGSLYPKQTLNGVDL